MKVCIVTVYNTHNCGSFLQAWSLAKVLSDCGHSVCFLKRDLSQTPYTKKAHLIIAIKKLLKLKFKAAKTEMQTHNAFQSALKSFDVIDINDEKINDIDCFIFGSDTIWNIEKSYFNNKQDIYFGKNIKGKKIAYAPSIAGTDINEFDNDSIKNALNDFYALSARDVNTQEMIKAIVGIDSPIVCDPTLLMSKNIFNEQISDRPVLQDSPIFLYLFDNMTPSNINTIKKIAKEKGKKIVAMGRDCNWADKVIPFDPYLFLQYYRDSSLVITNTYHGTIFSLIYQKDFVCLGKGKAKVEHIINMVGANNILIEKNDDILPIIKSSIDYTSIEKTLNDIKDNSIKYIKDSINEK